MLQHLLGCASSVWGWTKRDEERRHALQTNSQSRPARRRRSVIRGGKTEAKLVCSGRGCHRCTHTALCSNGKFQLSPPPPGAPTTTRASSSPGSHCCLARCLPVCVCVCVPVAHDERELDEADEGTGNGSVTGGRWARRRAAQVGQCWCGGSRGYGGGCAKAPCIAQGGGAALRGLDVASRAVVDNNPPQGPSQAGRKEGGGAASQASPYLWCPSMLSKGGLDDPAAALPPLQA